MQTRRKIKMTYSVYPLFLLCLYTTLSCVRCVPEVKTGSTLIKGSEIQYGNLTVNQYTGIPFAVPPVGDLRFRKTVPLEELPQELNATSVPPACSQMYPFDYEVVDNMSESSEDCLYLNIWVPGDACPDNPKAVMIWFYAGSFTTGSNRLLLYNGTKFAAIGNMIVVIPNYRLGIFGFLSTYSEKAPGNMGLYDALEALKWVNTNIESFGGDKNRITISGNTAGSVVGSFFTVSPLTKGLFQRVIMESAADNVVRGDVKQYNLRIGQQVATAVNCTSGYKTLQNNTDEVIECLKKKTAKELVSAVLSVIKSSLSGFLPNVGDEILPENQTQAFKNGNAQNISILIGNCQNEGTFQLVSVYPEVFGPYGEKDPDINKTLGQQFIDGLLSMDQFDSNARGKIIDYYLSNVSDTNYDEIRYQTAMAIGDATIFCNSYFYTQLSSGTLPVRYFIFGRKSPVSKFADWTGVTLFADVPYVFGIPIGDAEHPDDSKLSEEIVRLWSNFVKDGDPSPDWKTFKGSDSCPYVKILGVDEDDQDCPNQRFKVCDDLRPYISSYNTD